MSGVGEVTDTVFREPVFQWTAVVSEGLLEIDGAQQMAGLDGVPFGGEEQMIELVELGVIDGMVVVQDACAGTVTGTVAVAGVGMAGRSRAGDGRGGWW